MASALNPVAIPPSNRNGGGSGGHGGNSGNSKNTGNGGSGVVFYGGVKTQPPATVEKTNFIVKELNTLEVFKLVLFTGLAFSVVFIVSESIPVFVEAMSDDFSDSAIRGIAIGIWLPFSVLFVLVATRCI